MCGCMSSPPVNPTSENNCNIFCPGDSRETCGGGNYISFHKTKGIKNLNFLILLKLI